MKKLMVLLMAISLLALSVPVLAQCSGDPGGCNVDFDVDVNKTVDIDKNVWIDKYFQFLVLARIDPESLAECDVFKCDLNEDNVVDSYVGTYTDDLYNSFNQFTGIGQANQAAGFANNQGNIVAAAVVSTNLSAAAMTEVAVSQINYNNDLISFEDWTFDTITDSFNRFEGIGQANQAAGHMNNQNNVVAISAGLGSYVCDDLVATNDTFLTQTNTDNYAFATYALSANNINNSFNGFTGIGQVNQSSGSMNNQANIVSIAYTGPRP
jgi:hypothetical protein